MRVRRDLLRRSSIGAIFTGRSVSTYGGGSNETYGVDGTFAFHDNLRINTYWARTRTPGLSGDDVSHRAQVDYAGDRYGVQVERLVVGDNFNPEVGFLQRDDFERSFGLFRFSPRPQSITAIRKLTWEGRLDYFTDRGGVLETRQAQGVFGILFENTDQFTATYARGPIHDQCGDDADDLHSHPADVRQRAGAVQLAHPFSWRERPPALGVSAGE